MAWQHDIGSIADACHVMRAEPLLLRRPPAEVVLRPVSGQGDADTAEGAVLRGRPSWLRQETSADGRSSANLR